VFFSDVTWSQGPRGPSVGSRPADTLRFDPKSGAVSVFRPPSGMADGLAIETGCGLLATEGADRGGGRITRAKLETGRAETLLGSFRERSNGIAVSPDATPLYLAIRERGDRRPFGRSVPRRTVIERREIDARGRRRDGRVGVDFAGGDGADGLPSERAGGLRAAVRRGDRPGIRALDEEDRERAPLPVPAPTDLAFGRPAEDDVSWVAAEKRLFRIRVGEKGHRLQN